MVETTSKSWRFAHCCSWRPHQSSPGYRLRSLQSSWCRKTGAWAVRWTEAGIIILVTAGNKDFFNHLKKILNVLSHVGTHQKKTWWIAKHHGIIEWIIHILGPCDVATVFMRNRSSTLQPQMDPKNGERNSQSWRNIKWFRDIFKTK